jgi:predicted dehydrogenase
LLIFRGNALGGKRSSSSHGAPVRVGLIGAGGIATAHIQSLQALPNVGAVAISDPAETRARNLADGFGIPSTYGSHREMLEAETIDVVHILTPPDSHVAIALDAIRAGCDVLVEKPLGLSTAECIPLREEATRLGRIVGVNHSDAHAPAFRRLLNVVQERKLGAINHMTVTYAIPRRTLPERDAGHYMFRAPGNIAFEFGPHPFSMIRIVMGELHRMSTVATGRVRLPNGLTYYSSWLCSMECSRGTAQLVISLGRGLKEITTLLIGQDGLAFADSTRGILQSYKSTPRLMTGNFLASLSNGTHAIGSTFGSLIAQIGAQLTVLPYYTPNGFSQSIHRFYKLRAAGLSLAEGIDAGIEVVNYCETMARSAPEPEAPEWPQVTQ